MPVQGMKQDRRMAFFGAPPSQFRRPSLFFERSGKKETGAARPPQPLLSKGCGNFPTRENAWNTSQNRERGGQKPAQSDQHHEVKRCKPFADLPTALQLGKNLPTRSQSSQKVERNTHQKVTVLAEGAVRARRGITPRVMSWRHLLETPPTAGVLWGF